MISYPKISIVTPSFNQSDFLESCILSILSQNYPNLEYIVIDGGSTDGSVDIIKKYEGQLHFWCSESDAGQYDAINKGFKYATGDIMGWLNSDDQHLPWTLQTVGSIMSQLPEVDWLTTLQPGVFDINGFCLGFFPLSGYSQAAFLEGAYLPIGRSSIGYIQQESTFWRRSLWEKAGGSVRTDLKLASDFELWARLFQFSDLYGVNSPLAGFRRQPQQRSIVQQEAYIQEAKRVLDELRRQSSWKPNLVRNVCRTIGVPQVPKIRTIFQTLYCYLGKRIVRQDFDKETATWAIQDYFFS
ncbi:MAG: glycosyltransferase family 2 protein [Cyanobacteria bacterium J06634_6]